MMKFNFNSFAESDFYKKLEKLEPNYSKANFRAYYRCNNDQYLLTTSDNFYFYKKPTENNFLSFWKWYFRIFTFGLSYFFPLPFFKAKVIEMDLKKLPRKHKEDALKFINSVDEKENLHNQKLEEKEKLNIEKERLLKLQQKLDKKQQKLEKKEKYNEEKKRLENLEVSQNKVLNELDKDGNGEVDVLEGNDFKLLLEYYQEEIILIDRDYIKQFIKVSSYLNSKKRNIQDLFNSIKKIPNEKSLKNYVKILKNEIYTYNLILFNSLNMIVSLSEDDMITFYEIHESFDNLNMFDSKHEQDISNKLSKISDGLKDVSNNLLNIEHILGNLMSEVKVSSDRIIKSMHKLTYVTEKTNENLSNNLKKINSTLKIGNIINGINLYQNYQIRKKMSK